MRKLVSAALVAAVMLTVGAGHASGDPADQGSCIGNRDNGGAAGARISPVAGPGFGPAVADAIGGGVIGATASDPACRRP